MIEVAGGILLAVFVLAVLPGAARGIAAGMAVAGIVAGLAIVGGMVVGLRWQGWALYGAVGLLAGALAWRARREDAKERKSKTLLTGRL